MRKIATFVIAGTAASIASAQSSLDIERAYAAELSADAAERSSLLQGSGEGSGFSLTSGDGASTLNINAFFQFRYVANFRDDGQSDGGAGQRIPKLETEPAHAAGPQRHRHCNQRQNKYDDSNHARGRGPLEPVVVGLLENRGAGGRFVEADHMAIAPETGPEER